LKPEKDHIVKNHPHKVRLTNVLAANLTMKSVLALIIKFMAYEGPIITVTMVGDVDGP